MLKIFNHRIILLIVALFGLTRPGYSTPSCYDIVPGDITYEPGDAYFAVPFAEIPDYASQAAASLACRGSWGDSIYITYGCNLTAIVTAAPCALFMQTNMAPASSASNMWCCTSEESVSFANSQSGGNNTKFPYVLRCPTSGLGNTSTCATQCNSLIPNIWSGYAYASVTACSSLGVSGSNSYLCCLTDTANTFATDNRCSSSQTSTLDNTLGGRAYTASSADTITYNSTTYTYYKLNAVSSACTTGGGTLALGNAPIVMCPVEIPSQCTSAIAYLLGSTYGNFTIQTCTSLGITDSTSTYCGVSPAAQDIIDANTCPSNMLMALSHTYGGHAYAISSKQTATVNSATISYWTPSSNPYGMCICDGYSYGNAKHASVATSSDCSTCPCTSTTEYNTIVCGVTHSVPTSFASASALGVWLTATYPITIDQCKITCNSSNNCYGFDNKGTWVANDVCPYEE